MSSKKDSWDVFHEDEAGSYLTNDAGHVRPDRRLRPVDDPETLPCGRDVGAGESTNDEIHLAAPRSAIEGSGICVYRSRIQGVIKYARYQYSDRKGFSFDVSDSSAIRNRQFEREVESSDPTKEREDGGSVIPGMYIHTRYPPFGADSIRRYRSPCCSCGRGGGNLLSGIHLV